MQHVPPVNVGEQKREGERYFVLFEGRKIYSDKIEGDVFVNNCSCKHCNARFCSLKFRRAAEKFLETKR